MSFKIANRFGVAALLALCSVGIVACESTWSASGKGTLTSGTGVELGIQYDGNTESVQCTNGTGQPMDMKFFDKSGHPIATMTGVTDGATITLPPGTGSVVLTLPGTPPPGLMASIPSHLPQYAARRVDYSVCVLPVAPDFANTSAITNLQARFIVHGVAGLSIDELWQKVSPIVLGGPGTAVPANVTVDCFVKMTAVSGGARLIAADTGHFTGFRLNWNSHPDYATLADMTNVSLAQWDNHWEVATTFIPAQDFDLSGGLNGCTLDLVNDAHEMSVHHEVTLTP